MMQAGIFTGYFPYSLKETAQKIRALNFNTVQLDLHFKDIDLSAGQITGEKAKTVRDTFRDHNLPVCCISGYTNIIHPDKTERASRVGYLKEIIRNARHFGTPYVISETGTYLSPQAWVKPGAPMAYLIAPPLEATVAVYAALKAAPVKLAKWIPPPSETNFAGAFLTGALADLNAARDAFIDAIEEVAKSPLQASRRPDRLRR